MCCVSEKKINLEKETNRFIPQLLQAAMIWLLLGLALIFPSGKDLTFLPPNFWV